MNSRRDGHPTDAREKADVHISQTHVQKFEVFQHRAMRYVRLHDPNPSFTHSVHFEGYVGVRADRRRCRPEICRVG